MIKDRSETSVTIHDVARSCGLSSSTVSRALNGKHVQYRISDQARSRVLETADRLGFKANWKAKTLTDRRSFQIGMLFQAAFPEFRGIFAEILTSLNNTLEAAGYHLLFVPVHDERGLQLIQQHRLDGLILCDPHSNEIHSILHQIDSPLVVLNELAPDAGFSHVIPDEEQGMRLALDHLFAFGHEKIAFFRMGRHSSPTHFSLECRRSAFNASMAERGLAGYAITADESVDSFLSRVKIGPGGHTAIICYSHTEAAFLLRALLQKGLRVPQDVSLIAYNNTFPMDALFPAITVIDVPAKKMGEVGAKLLLEQINGESKPRHVTLPESLIVRESTGPAPRGGSGPIARL